MKVLRNRMKIQRNKMKLLHLQKINLHNNLLNFKNYQNKWSTITKLKLTISENITILNYKISLAITTHKYKKLIKAIKPK